MRDKRKRQGSSVGEGKRKKLTVTANNSFALPSQLPKSIRMLVPHSPQKRCGLVLLPKKYSFILSCYTPNTSSSASLLLLCPQNAIQPPKKGEEKKEKRKRRKR